MMLPFARHHAHSSRPRKVRHTTPGEAASERPARDGPDRLSKALSPLGSCT